MLVGLLFFLKKEKEETGEGRPLWLHPQNSGYSPSHDQSKYVAWQTFFSFKGKKKKGKGRDWGSKSC